MQLKLLWQATTFEGGVRGLGWVYGNDIQE